MITVLLLALAASEQEIDSACGILCPHVSRQCAADITCATCHGDDCNANNPPACCSRLGYGDGDCDHDSDCMGDLLCGRNNCGDFRDAAGWPTESELGWDTTDDCCYAANGDSHFFGGVVFGAFLVLAIGSCVACYHKGWCSQIEPAVGKIRELAGSRARTGTSTPPLSASDTYRAGPA